MQQECKDIADRVGRFKISLKREEIGSGGPVARSGARERERE
jgi:hypothetical protein